MKPTPEQIDALNRFAMDNGRCWKSALRDLWQYGPKDRGSFSIFDRVDVGILMQIRNTLGPSFLVRFQPTKKIDFLMTPEAASKLAIEKGVRPQWRDRIAEMLRHIAFRGQEGHPSRQPIGIKSIRVSCDWPLPKTWIEVEDAEGRRWELGLDAKAEFAVKEVS